MAEIRWYGHNCVRVKSKEATLLVDPVGKNTGYSVGKQTADIVLISHEHPGHNNINAIKPDYELIDGPGEYEVHKVFIFGLRTLHGKDKADGYNTVYSFQMDGIRFAHLGDLGADLSHDVQEALEDTDVLFAPVGGGPILSPSEMAQIVGTVSPKIVIPIQFKTAKGDSSRETADAFAKQLGVELPEPLDKLTLKSSDLGEEMRIVLLNPES